MKNQATICGLYTRVSSRNQLEPEFNSLEAQKERLEAYCKAQDYSVYRLYEDGAYSGDSLDRPALRQMMADIREGRINCVVAYKIDRLTRSVKDFHELLALFERQNVSFVAVTQNLDTQTPTGRLMRNILLDFAQFEREMTADRTRDKMHQRAQKGMWNGGNVPYGFENQNKKLVPRTQEAQRIKFMFEHFSKSPSLAGLRDELARRGWMNRAGKPWSKTALAHVLANPIYSGKVRFEETLFNAEHGSIVDELTFSKCQSAKKLCTHPKARTERTFLLRGLLRCAECGSAMSPHYTQKTRRGDGHRYKIPYYRCTRTMHFNNGVCSIRSANANELEAGILEGLAGLSENGALVENTIKDLNRDLKRQSAPLQRELADVKKRLAEVGAEIGRYVKAVGKGTFSVQRLEREIRELEKEEKLLLANQEELQRKINESVTRDFDATLVKRALNDFRRAFKALEPREQAETLQTVLKGVVVHSNKFELEVFELPELVPVGSTKSERWLLGLDSNQQPSG
jgi:site-specific DNA recombinase